MSCLSWTHIFHESWENKYKFQIGGLRETGGLPLFSPEGRTYSPPRRHKLHILRPAASGRSHPFRCASFSHKVSDFVGALLRRWYACGIVRSPRGIAASAEASRQCHSTCECCCHRLRRRQIPCDGRSKSWGRNSLPPLPPACANLPPAALPQRWTVRSHRPFSLLRKRNRKKETR